MLTQKESDIMGMISIPSHDSASQRIAINKQKISLLTALNEVLKERRSAEHRRNALLQSAVSRQHQVQETKNKCDAAWTEKIAEAVAFGKRLESQCHTLREKREALHKQLMSSFEGTAPVKAHTNDFPSIRANYKMQAVQLQKDIADLKRRVNNAKFRVETERKNRGSLDTDVKILRNEAGAKKIHTASLRPQTLAMVTHPERCRPAREQYRAQVLRNTPKLSPIKTRGKAL